MTNIFGDLFAPLIRKGYNIKFSEGELFTANSVKISFTKGDAHAWHMIQTNEIMQDPEYLYHSIKQFILEWEL